jgi:HEPN domain-containing protein
MIDRTVLRRIVCERLKDAQALLKAGRYDGAIYLGGYVVELALKCRICRTLKWSSFPQTRGEFQSFQSFKTHDLDVLLSLSGVKDKIKTRYLAEWSAVATWDPEARYNPVGSTSKTDAELLIEAARKLLSVL